MNQRVKLLLLIPHLGGGGAERVVAQLARHLDAQCFDIQLVLITQDLPGAEAIPSWVKVHRFECRRVRSSWRRLLRLMWAERPDVLLSGMAHLSFLVLLLRVLMPRRTRVVIRQNTTASKALTGWHARFGYRFFYPRADAIVCQSEAMADDLVEGFGIARSKVRVLRNPVNLDRPCVQDGGDASETFWPVDAWPRLISVGRLSPEKGFDLLLKAAGRLRLSYPRLHTIVLGEGESRGELESLAGELGLADAVRFPGYRSDVQEFYQNATLFVLPSRYEGMPNSLLEAAACGLPLVATRCCGGVTKILEGVPGAWLAEAIRAGALADAICAALARFRSISDASPRFEHSFLAPFECGQAVAGYADLFLSLVSRSGVSGSEVWRSGVLGDE